MTTEDPRPDGNVDTTPAEERESEEVSEQDLESLFDDSQDDSETDAPVTREEIKRLEKGIKHLATKIGREKVEKPAEQPKSEPSQNDDLKEMFYANTEKAKLVKDLLEDVAKKYYNGSIIKAWNGEQYLRDKANSMAEAKEVEEKSKSKISKPSSKTGEKVDFSHVKTVEDYKKLTSEQRAEYNRLQKLKEE